LDIGKQAYNFPNLSVIYTSISRQYGDAAIDFGGKDKRGDDREKRKEQKKEVRRDGEAKMRRKFTNH
jgi:hypothetical protein